MTDIAVDYRLFQADNTVHSIGSDKSPIEAGRISA
jgi:hypothetical protein